MTFRAIEWLSQVVGKEWEIFEFGSGGSTLFFVKRCKRLVSVEHDPEWYCKVQSTLMVHDVDRRCDYRLIPPDIIGRGIAAVRSTRYPVPCADFSRYVRAIDELPDAKFDLISIDGRARVACARHAMSRVRPGGYIALDNSERDDYSDIYHMFHGWDLIEFYGPGPYNVRPWKTSVWKAPGQVPCSQP